MNEYERQPEEERAENAEKVEAVNDAREAMVEVMDEAREATVEAIDEAREAMVPASGFQAPASGAVETAFEAPAAAAAAEVSPDPAPLPEAPFYNETVKSAPKAVNRKKRHFRRVAALVCAASLLGGAALGFGAAAGVTIARGVWVPKLLDDSGQTKNFTFPENGVTATGSFSQETGLFSYSDVVKRVEPSTVVITSTIEQQGMDGGYFFQIPRGEVTGAGTGIIFAETDASYYVATNAHVIDGAMRVDVSVGGSEPIEAHPVGKDGRVDLAVISVAKADAIAAGVHGAPVAAFGDSDQMEMGDVVLAIGNSLGEGNVATNGIISAKEKEIVVDGRSLTVLQTNAAINKGNSGGPLVNLKGEVIGINTAKLSSTTDASIEGTGYAISSKVAMPILTRLMQTGQTGAPIIGIVGRTLTEDVADRYNLPPLGVLVTSVSDGLPAQKAGIQPGDIITGLDDASVLSMDQLIEAIQSHSVGDQVTIKIIRNGKDSVTVSLALAANKTEGF